MSPADNVSRADSYDAFYREFDSPLMRQIRAEAYGEDVGQHSWVSAQELREDAERLRLTSSSRLLDLGSGPCGPLTFLMSLTGCSGTALDLSPAAIAVGTARAAQLGVQARFAAFAADLNEPLPAELGHFDAVLALDMVLHVRDRSSLLRPLAQVLAPRGRLLITDAGVVTGPVSHDEIRKRSVYGYTQFVPDGWNEAALRQAGFRVLQREDRTASVVEIVSRRLQALASHRQELEQFAGVTSFQAQVEYLNTVRDLASRGALSRFMYLCEPGGVGPS